MPIKRSFSKLFINISKIDTNNLVLFQFLFHILNRNYRQSKCEFSASFFVYIWLLILQCIVFKRIIIYAAHFFTAIILFVLLVLWFSSKTASKTELKCLKITREKKTRLVYNFLLMFFCCWQNEECHHHIFSYTWLCYKIQTNNGLFPDWLRLVLYTRYHQWM